jgi:uncharacterized protein related to proFAR isomerase
MLILPAIDLRNGKCVRLKQGRVDQETVYSDDPVAMAQHWEKLGAKYLHLVDLDGVRIGDDGGGGADRVKSAFNAAQVAHSVVNDCDQRQAPVGVKDNDPHSISNRVICRSRVSKVWRESRREGSKERGGMKSLRSQWPSERGQQHSPHPEPERRVPQP